jgi:hypothetical protein
LPAPRREIFPSVLKENRQLACKPGSVWLRSPGTWQPFIWDDARAPPLATHPDDEAGNGPGACAHVSSLFGLAPGGVCHAVSVARSAVGSYPTFSPLPGEPGGIFSVALSLGSPPPDVIRRRISVEPGLSSPHSLSAFAKRGCPANWQGCFRAAGHGSEAKAVK